MATLEKYLPKLTVIEHKNGSKEAVATKEILVRAPKPKFVCGWVTGQCNECVEGFCTHVKYCSQKGEVL